MFRVKEVKAKYPECKLVVHIHWGVEDVYYPEPEKIELGHKIVDAGADLIIGTHPHIIQPLEIYNGKHIFYSLGNVITSYSIHYTKLYDFLNRTFRIRENINNLWRL